MAAVPSFQVTGVGALANIFDICHFVHTSTILSWHQKHTKSRSFDTKITQIHIHNPDDTNLEFLTPAPHVVHVTNIRYGGQTGAGWRQTNPFTQPSPDHIPRFTSRHISNFQSVQISAWVFTHHKPRPVKIWENLILTPFDKTERVRNCPDIWSSQLIPKIDLIQW